MLGLSSVIIERIKDQVQGFTVVGGPSMLAGLDNETLAQQFPACIVVPGPGTSLKKDSTISTGLETQTWDVIVIVGHQYTESVDGQTEIIAGNLMKAVRNALHGQIIDADKQRRQFNYDSREAPNYAIGYAEFPLTFTVDAVS